VSRLRGRPWFGDTVLGVATSAVAEVELLLLAPSQIDGAVAGHHLLNLLIVPAFALRRVVPVGAVAVACLGFVVQPVIGSAPTATPYLSLLFLVGSLGWCASRRAGLLGVVLVLVTGIGGDAVLNGARWADVVVNAVIICAAWAVLHVVRLATDRRVRAEVDADRQARAAVDAERTRIAQDLHDSLAHALTLITLQAGVGSERTTDPTAAETFDAIGRSGREALTDMHRFLGLLGPRRAEAPGLAHLAELLEGVRASGLAVELDIEPDLVDGVPSSISTTAYRVVQEGLTNIVRHSSARTARVRVHRVGADLVTEVRDDGRRTTPRTTGARRGLDGLRRRVSLFDGSVASAATDDGWLLQARIPLSEGLSARS
jgi:signal transduction histidine kinase